MKKSFFVTVILLLSLQLFAQTAEKKPEILVGTVQRNELQKDPFNQWYDSIYAAYKPDEAVTRQLKKNDLRNIRFELFFGTWCGDSRRELPRFLKILDELPVRPRDISLIGLYASDMDSLYKRSPGHEEAGKGIFRVPVFIVYKNDVEIGRINEYPVNSLEKDLQAILSGQAYTPNYKSFALVKTWLADGTLLDKNTSSRGLAMQVKQLVASEYELNGVGHLLLKFRKTEEALRLFQMNASLYPESAYIQSSLGKGYYEKGDKVNAITTLEHSLELNKEAWLVKEVLTILYKAKSL